MSKIRLYLLYAITSLGLRAWQRGRVKAIHDVTGDGAEDVLLEFLTHGAHTSHSTLLLYAWNRGGIEPVAGKVEMPNAAAVIVAERELRVTGGLIGSAGAGPWQRELRIYTVSSTGV